MRRTFLLLFIISSFACSPLIIYRNLPEVQAWETEIHKFEELDKNETYPDNSVLFTGSSSILRWESLSEEMAPYPVIQRGYGGAKLSDFAVYAERIIYPHNSSAIVIFIANDIAGSPTDKEPQEVLKLFRYVVKTIRKKFPETPVFWISITPTQSRWEVWPEIREANYLIRNYCEKTRDLYFIDTENFFLNKDAAPRNELFVADMLHLNAEGYGVWTKIIKNELDKVLKHKYP